MITSERLRQEQLTRSVIDMSKDVEEHGKELKVKKLGYLK